MSKLFILGAGGFGFETEGVAHDIRASRQSSGPLAGLEQVIFLDDSSQYAEERGVAAKIGGSIAGHQVVDDAVYVCAIASPRVRKAVCGDLASRGARFVSLVHPAARVADNARVGAGSVLAAGAFVSTFCDVGEHVHINMHSTIGHDAKVGDFCTLSGHVDITGACQIGEGVFFGTHSCVLPRQNVGDWARIGAQVHVAKRVREGTTLYALPPKVLTA